MTPEFVTFTGLDDRTPLWRAMEIARRWPVEWGVLFSRNRQGRDPRYPDDETISMIWNANFPRLAAHLCGSYADDVMTGAVFHPPADLGYARRVQVNHRQPDANRIRAFAKGWGIRGIGQARQYFPADTQIDWLFDASGGRGIVPSEWPAHPIGRRLVGFAGGLSLENVADAMRAIGSKSGRYWLDMESGIRTDNWLDLDKCEAVCRIIFATEEARG